MIFISTTFKKHYLFNVISHIFDPYSTATNDIGQQYNGPE